MQDLKPHAAIRDAKRRGEYVCRQHFLLLLALMATPGSSSYELLAQVIGSRAKDVRTLVGTRISTLRRVVAPFGYIIQNQRNLGYKLTCLPKE